MKKRTAILLAAVLAATAFAALFCLFKGDDCPSRSFSESDIRCALAFGGQEDTTARLTCGYNYEILRIFAEETCASFSAVVPADDEDYLDSLKRGRIDMLLVPDSYPFDRDSVLCSVRIDSSSFWLLPENDRTRLQELDSWINAYNTSETRARLRERFFTNFHNPFNIARLERKCRTLSPYDSLFRHYSALVGWDWRLLSAVAFHESRFRIEARSSKGAVGIMQMMDDSARRFGAGGDALDPEQSIKAATAYLSHLQRIFRNYAEGPENLQKFALAAYNAGEGHILDCIRYGAFKGSGCSTWEELAEILPEMAEDSILQIDTVKLGKFNSAQTLNYVASVTDLYDVFLEICP